MGYYRGDCSRGDYYRGDYYRGDPFSLGGLLKGVTGVVARLGVPGVSTVAGGINSLLGGGGKSVSPSPVSYVAPYSGPPRAGISAQLGPFGISAGTVPPSWPGGPVGQAFGQANPGVSLTPQGALVPCQMKGYRPNKSNYYRSGGQFIAKGSVCVKSRRMNPTNGRALRRALTRAYAFKKIAMKAIRLVNAGQKPKRFGGFKKKR